MVLTCYPDELEAQEHVADLVEANGIAAQQQQQQIAVNGVINGHSPPTGSPPPAPAVGVLPVNNQDNISLLQLD